MSDFRDAFERKLKANDEENQKAEAANKAAAEKLAGQHEAAEKNMLRFVDALQDGIPAMKAHGFEFRLSGETLTVMRDGRGTGVRADVADRFEFMNIHESDGQVIMGVDISTIVPGVQDAVKELGERLADQFNETR